jgi:hypothetical protein
MSGVKQTMLPVDQIMVDDRYQHSVNEKWVGTIVRDFDPHLFVPINVAKRDDGTYYAVDGHQRLRAAKVMGLKKIPCVLHDGITVQDEARVFVGLHMQRRNPAPVERFKARVFQGDKIAVAVQGVITECGFTVGKNGDGAIKAITAAEKAYRELGAEVLREALQVLSDAWYGEKDATLAPMISGMARFIAQYGDRFELRHVDRLRNTVPGAVIAAARIATSQGKHKGVTGGVAAELRKRTGITGRARSVNGGNA